MLTSSIETTTESEINEHIINVYYRPRVLAFESFKETDNLDSFEEMGFGDQIKLARELLSEDSSNLAVIKEQFLEYGNCLINEFKNENNKAQEKLEKLDGCKYGEALEKLRNEINVSLYSPSDSQSSS